MGVLATDWFGQVLKTRILVRSSSAEVKADRMRFGSIPNYHGLS